jgi:alkylated DNA repair dioxygenase AlkB
MNEPKKRTTCLDLSNQGIRAQAWLIDNYLTKPDADQLFAHLEENKDMFIQHQISVFGQTFDQPRLTCSMGQAYSYSKSTHPQSPWDANVKAIMEQVNHDLDCSFNSCLLNKYRNGRDCIGQHSDDERQLDRNGLVACLSLGATRLLYLRFKKKSQKNKKSCPILKRIPLTHGSLFVMEGLDFQRCLNHEIPRVAAERVGTRISLTFRKFVV